MPPPPVEFGVKPRKEPTPSYGVPEIIERLVTPPDAVTESTLSVRSFNGVDPLRSVPDILTVSPCSY